VTKRNGRREQKTRPATTSRVAERGRTEDALRESEATNRALLDAMPDMLFRVARDGTYLDFIPGVAAEPLVEPSQFIGKKVREVMPAELVGQIVRAIERALESGQTQSMDYQLTYDGEPRYFEARISPCGENEALAAVRDITERRRAEEALMARAHQQAAVAELGQRALTGLDLSALLDETVALLAQVLKVEFCKVLQLLPDGGTFLLQSGVGWKEGYVGHATVGAKGQSQAGYTLLYDAPVVVEDLSTETRFSTPPLLAEHGVVSGMSVIIQGSDRPYGVLGAHTTRRRTFSEDDIHFLQAVANVLGEAIERERAEDALRESEERYRSLYTKTPAMLHSIDTAGRVLAVNDRWLEVLGYERNEVIGRKVVGFLTDDSRRFAETVGGPRFWKVGSARDVAYQFVKKNGEVADVLLSAVVERDGAGNAVSSLAVLNDVTDRNRLEEALQRAREELEGKIEREMLQDNPYRLTFREFTVLHLVATGRADKEIAGELVISPLTVHKHVANILAKMTAASRTEAGVRALREGWLD
jgi:PAS domain S-box-containing protein